MNVTRQFAVVIMLVTLSLVLAAISPAFGCTSLPAAQPWRAQFNTEIAQARQLVAGWKVGKVGNEGVSKSSKTLQFG
jgi:hypothetical protein